MDTVETNPSEFVDTSYIPTDGENSDQEYSDSSNENSESEEENEEEIGVEETTGVAEDMIELSLELIQEPGNMGSSNLGERLISLTLLILLVISFISGFIYGRKRFRVLDKEEQEIIYDISAENEVEKCFGELIKIIEADPGMSPEEVRKEAQNNLKDNDIIKEKDIDFIVDTFIETRYGQKKVTNKKIKKLKDNKEKLKIIAD